MNKDKKKKIKKIIEQAELEKQKESHSEHRPQTINLAKPRSYFEQGYADINKSRYIQGAEMKDEPLTKEKVLVSETSENIKKEEFEDEIKRRKGKKKDLKQEHQEKIVKKFEQLKKNQKKPINKKKEKEEEMTM